MYEEVGKFVGVGLRVDFGREVAALFAPFTDASHNAADQLPNAGLAFGCADMAAEILRHDDVSRELTPGLRDLDVVLLEDDEEAVAALLDSVGSENSIRSVDASEVETILRNRAATVLYSLSPNTAQQDIRVLQVKSTQDATSHRVAEWVTMHGMNLDFVIELHCTVMHLSASTFISPSDVTKDAIMFVATEDLDTEDQDAIATMQASELLLDLIDELSELAVMTPGLTASNTSPPEDEGDIVALLEEGLKWTVNVPTQRMLFAALHQPLQFMLSKAKVKVASVKLTARLKEDAKR